VSKSSGLPVLSVLCQEKFDGIDATLSEFGNKSKIEFDIFAPL
jgi:hypothetical protein